MKPLEPYLNSSGIDFGTGIRHCLGCHDALNNPHTTLNDHIFGQWMHYLWYETPDILATDERGMTLEGVVAIPARRFLSVLPSHTGVSYCSSCLPSLQGEGCGGCGLAVDTTDEHTVSHLLWKRASDQYNGPLRIILWHIGCLPDEFQAVKDQASKST